MILKYLLLFLIGLIAIFILRFSLEEGIRNDQAIIINNILSGWSRQAFPREEMPDLLAYRDSLAEDGQDFLEINLTDKKVYFYQKGQIAKTAEILKLGEKATWGGTPSGLYSVLARNHNAYSPGAEAYMPYALKFYGKYFLHGKPYYDSGEPYISEFSGGCVQVSDEDAEDFFSLARTGLPVLVVEGQNIQCPELALAGGLFPKIQAGNYLVADLDCGEILAQKNSQNEAEVGSLLNFLEAVVVAEIVDLRDDISVSAKAEEMGCEKEDVLEAGGYYRVIDLFYSLLSEDSPKARWLLGAFLGRQRTPQLMQEKAKSIMMASTTIGNVFSCDSPGNVSTARDLFYLAKYMQNARPPLLVMSSRGRVRTFGPLPFSLNNLSDQNIFSEDENFVGGGVSLVGGSQYNGLFVFHFSSPSGQERNIAIILLQENSLDSLREDTLKIKGWLN